MKVALQMVRWHGDTKNSLSCFGTAKRRLPQLTTIGNSVSSELAFSTMNYIHSKLRNRLSVERADKLQYIFINCRALAKQIALQPTTPTTEELLAIEELDEMGIGMVWEN
jgi:hypothetical protein